MLRLIYFFFLIMLASCSGIEMKAPEPEKERETIFGGPLKFSTETGGFSVGSPRKNSSMFNTLKKNDASGNIPVNALLWNASLDIIDFIPLYIVDAYGGVIVTDWFTNDDNNNVRFKTTISFNSSELKVSSFRVSVIRQKLIDGNWVEDGSSDALARKIEDLILSRARELRRN